MGKRLSADLGALSKYGNFMVDKAQEFNSITTKMSEIIENLEKSWSGVDASLFIKNAKTYIGNLKAVETSLDVNGKYLLGKVSSYNKICDEFSENRAGR